MAEIRVLVFTSILPIKEISHKRDENDILLETERYLNQNHSDIKFHYVFTIPKTPIFMGLLSKKWQSYYSLQKQKYTLTKDGKSVDVLGYFILPKVHVFDNFLKWLTIIWEKKRIQKIVRNFKPTVVHAHTIKGGSYLANYIKREYHIPYVVTVRGVNEKTKRKDINHLQGAKHLIALSPYQKKLLKKISDREIKLIPHGVPGNYFHSGSTHQHKIGNQVRLISVCRLLASKNIADNLQALADIKGDFTYHIYGRGPEQDNLQALIQRYNLEDKVELRGFIENNQLAELLVTYDLFVLPSYPESLGRVYLESIACGIPVIACKDTGVDGIITHGKEGFLVEKNDVNGLTGLLRHIIANPGELLHMKTEAKELANDFRWENISEKLYELYS